MISIKQHNIGDINRNLTDKIIHDGSDFYEKSNFISHIQPLDKFRTAENYINLSNEIKDIYTLQEVQEPHYELINSDIYNITTKTFIPKKYNDDITTSNIKHTNSNFNIQQNSFSCIYNRTGSNNYVDIQQLNPRKIYHGCCVVFNNDLFQYIETETLLKTHLESNYRTSKWVFLKHKLSNNYFAIISIHGKILSPFGKLIYENPYKHINNRWKNKSNHSTYNNPINKTLPIYQKLIYDIKLIKDILPNINIIINGDFNLNINSPNINPFSDELNPYKRKMIFEYKRIKCNQNDIIETAENQVNDTIQEFQNTFKLYDIQIIPNKLPTEITFDFPIDFMIIDNKLKLINFELEKHRDDFDKTIWLINDFDHKSLIIDFSLQF